MITHDYDVIIWDLRDISSPEPSSALGEYATERSAYRELRRYLAGEHGAYITRWEIRTQGTFVDGWEGQAGAALAMLS